MKRLIQRDEDRSRDGILIEHPPYGTVAVTVVEGPTEIVLGIAANRVFLTKAAVVVGFTRKNNLVFREYRS